MEILMNIKCSANGDGSSIRPTLKVVDHHHQLQQQHNSIKIHRPLGSHHASIHGKPDLTITARKESPLPPCMEYSAAMVDCCNAMQNSKGAIDLHWTTANQKRGNVCSAMNPAADCPPFCEYAPCCASMEVPPCCAGFNSSSIAPAMHMTSSFLETCSPMSGLNPNENSSYEYHEPEENFVSIEDEKVKEFLMKVGEAQKEQEKIEHDQRMVEEAIEKKKKDKPPAAPQPVVFQIIDLDDVDERERLQRIRESAERYAKEKEMKALASIPAKLPPPPPLVRGGSRQESRKPLNISLIPKSTVDHEPPPKPKEKIIARIDLVDSDSDEAEDEVSERKVGIAQDQKSTTENSRDDYDSRDDEDGDDLQIDEENDDSVSSRLIAATAVSCELGCDDETEEESANQSQENDASYSSAEEPIFIINSEDEENMEFIEEREEGVELRWDDLEDTNSSKERNLFECPVCGKKVQSNYNLRRHMMIHTGERPFGCDLCERRFREISDLKKHRRRHAAEKNFVCMICRVEPPLETDSTRCISCKMKEAKNNTVIAAVRPDTVKTPPEIEQMFGSSSRTDKRKVISTTPPLNLPPLTPIISRTSTEKTESVSSKGNTQPNSQATSHQALYRKEFACPLCSRSFGTRHNLKRHFMIHTGEKPFSCPSCRKPFREYSTLKKHMVTHRRDRWYKCLRCPNKYRDFLEYMDHKSTHSSDVSSDDGSVTPKKRSRYQNDDQEDAYFTNDEEDDIDFDDEDGLECCECGQRFSEIEKFTAHIKEHDSSRITFECYLCKQQFEDHKVLLEHMNEKHQTDESEA